MKRPLVIRPSPAGGKTIPSTTCKRLRTLFNTFAANKDLYRFLRTFDMQVTQADFIVITSQHCVATAAPFLQNTGSNFYNWACNSKKLQEYQLSSVYPLKAPSTETLFPLITKHAFEISGKLVYFYKEKIQGLIWNKCSWQLA